MLESTEDVNEEAFTVKLMELCDANCTNKKPWDRAKVKEVIKDLTEVKYIGNAKKTNKQYYLHRTYQVVETNGVQQVICKPKTESDPMVVVVPVEDYYKTLLEIHLSVGHGGRDKMAHALRTRCYIPRSVVDLFLTCCNTCNAKKTCRKFVLRPINSTDYNIRAQVDIIDLNSTPDKQYKFLMCYHDHFTRFCNLRPLISNEIPEVANELLKIFYEFGAPRILQSENGRNFASSLVSHLFTLNPDFKMVHGNHERTTSTLKGTIKEVEEQLKMWMADNNSLNWSLGCYHLQWQRNNSLIGEIGGRTPYTALFGRESTSGLSGLSASDEIDSEVFVKITTEEELEGILENKNEKKIVLVNNKVCWRDKATQVSEDPQFIANDVETLPMMCCVCNMETIGSNTCSKCHRLVHTMCGEVATDEIGTSVVICTLCRNKCKTKSVVFEDFQIR